MKDAALFVLYVLMSYSPLLVPLLGLAAFLAWRSKRKQKAIRENYSPDRAARYEKGRK